ncbi:hypothetical protein BV898_03965 [Hypsibius exemplaris]|uniref:Chitin-binding type-3 domain-containing protein n=1 Tax=Hypsibius exemplaris TaxID=2072580 RepID=A0A1W0X3P5_HYPEX|nr:hypothetical protein BV898_03965 [Hypsibius exemplaris]
MDKEGQEHALDGGTTADNTTTDGGGEIPVDDEQAGNATGTPEAAAQVSAGGEWTKGATYSVGDVVTYFGASYQCRQGHRVDAADWTPPNTPSLWLPVAGSVAPPPWAQGKTYAVDERCSYDGQNYTCRQGHTAHAANWTPPNTLDLWLPDQ